MNGAQPSASTQSCWQAQITGQIPETRRNHRDPVVWQWDVFRTSKDGPAMPVTVRHQLDSVRRHD